MARRTFNPTMFQFAIRLFVTSVLIFAVISKLQMAPAILRGESLLSNPYLLYSAIIMESAVATFALLATSRWAWSAITVLFVTLTAFASWAFFANRECNCLGNVLPSGTSLPINIVVVTTMLLSRKQWGISQDYIKTPVNANHSQKNGQKLGKLPFCLVVAGIASLVAATISWIVLNGSLNSQKAIPNIRFLLADDWVGKSWPIDENFDTKLKELSVGNWLVLILASRDHRRGPLAEIDSSATCMISFF